ncbi:MAG: hypothetical protein AVDCRST_MAG19-1667, partial [uncultured Thermomicrobiales bacterium]
DRDQPIADGARRRGHLGPRGHGEAGERRYRLCGADRARPNRTRDGSRGGRTGQPLGRHRDQRAADAGPLWSGRRRAATGRQRHRLRGRRGRAYRHQLARRRRRRGVQRRVRRRRGAAGDAGRVRRDQRPGGRSGPWRDAGGCAVRRLGRPGPRSAGTGDRFAPRRLHEHGHAGHRQRRGACLPRRARRGHLLHQPDPARRRDQPRQLRRAALQPGRGGGRRQHAGHQPDPGAGADPGALFRHPERHRREDRRPTDRRRRGLLPVPWHHHAAGHRRAGRALRPRRRRGRPRHRRGGRLPGGGGRDRAGRRGRRPRRHSHRPRQPAGRVPLCLRPGRYRRGGHPARRRADGAGRHARGAAAEL